VPGKPSKQLLAGLLSQGHAQGSNFEIKQLVLDAEEALDQTVRRDAGTEFGPIDRS
jgi:hypothetical protein